MNKKAGVGKKILLVAVVVVLAAAIYFTFFFSYKCDDMACFQTHQEKCAKTKFVNDLEDAAWKYFIKKKSNGECVVNVELLQVKKGSLDLQKLEGKNMDCYLKLGDTASPESDISNCHGLLKEGMQDMIINKMYSYILDNLGEIDTNLKSIE